MFHHHGQLGFSERQATAIAAAGKVSCQAGPGLLRGEADRRAWPSFPSLPGHCPLLPPEMPLKTQLLSAGHRPPPLFWGHRPRRLGNAEALAPGRKQEHGANKAKPVSEPRPWIWGDRRAVAPSGWHGPSRNDSSGNEEKQRHPRHVTRRPCACWGAEEGTAPSKSRS